jgi:hypothetical protein
MPWRLLRGLRLLLAICCVSATVACLRGGPVGDFGDGGPDAGSPVEVECTDEECDPGLADEVACTALREVTCGSTCQESPACAAATLLSTYEPARCRAALDDTQTFPRCRLQSCEVLVLKVCGGDPPAAGCAEAPGCPPALALQARSSDPGASQEEIEAARSDCLQALEDEIVFAPCP